MRRASVEHIEKLYQSKADQARERRVSLTIMNCIWARNTERETTHPVHGEVVAGDVPDWLSGTLYRVGPGVIQSGDTLYEHLFDMPSVLHKYTLKPGIQRFTYQNRIVALTGEDTEEVNSQPPFGSKVRKLRAFFHGYSSKDSLDRCIDNVCMFPTEDSLYLLTDAAMALKVDPETLDTTDELLVRSISDVLFWGSHPLKEANEDILWNIGTSYDGSKFHYSVLRFKGGGSSAEQIALIPSRRKDMPCYIHSFAMTSKYVIIIEQPLFIDKTATNGINLHHHLKWKAHLPVIITLVEKDGGKVYPYQFECNPFFFFHTINAFDKNNDTIVVDIMAYKNADVIKDLRFCHIEKTDHVPSARATRLILPLFSQCNTNEEPSTIVVQSETLVPEPMDFPGINCSFRGQHNQFFYSIGKEILHPSMIHKIDADSKDILTWKESGFHVSEPIFVPKPHSQGEDEGILCINLLNNKTTSCSILLILDAKNLQELARIQFTTEGTIAQAMHGIFIPDY